MIAISYRREDSLSVAGRLYDRLEERFGKGNVFMDFDSIRPGFDFRDQIKETIDKSNVVVAVIGQHWLGEQSDGSRRIDDPADFVRLEVSCALQRGIRVIPVLVNNTPMPKPEALPSDIQALAFRHGLPLDSGLDFRQHTDRLINSISDTAGSSAVSPTARKRGPKFLPIAVGTASLLIVAAILLVGIYLWRGRPTESQRPTSSSLISAQPPAAPNILSSPAPATRFAGAWQGKIKIGTVDYEIILMVNANGTSLVQESKRDGQPAQHHPHMTTIDGDTLSWIGGDLGNVAWTFTPSTDDKTAEAKTNMAGVENTAIFTRTNDAYQPSNSTRQPTPTPGADGNLTIIQSGSESPTPVPGQSPSPQPTSQPKQGPCLGTWIGTLRGVPTIGDVEFTLVIAGAGNVVNEFSSAFGSRSWRATGDGTSIKWRDNWGCRWTLLPNGDGKTARVRCDCPLFNYPLAIFRKASL